MEQRRACIGIDLGTAYTRAASFDGNQVKMIPDQFGESAMPSYVAFTDSGVLIGRAARVQAPRNPTNTVFDVLRLIGRRYSDPTVQNDMRLWPFKVVAGPDDTLQVEVHWKGKLCQFTPVEICSMILAQIKENAQANIEASIRDAAVTVPALFDYQQRQAIKEAGMIAHLNILQIVSSPAATASFYGMERLSKISNVFNNFRHSVFGSDPGEYNMIIFDLGAGTLDVAVVTIKGNVCKVRATAGDVHLGGADFDNNLVGHFVNSLKLSGREDISSSPIAISNLRTLCEKAKISLSSSCIMAPMKITPLYSDVDLNSSITEAEFIVLNNDLFSKCIRIIKTCLLDAELSIDTVHEVILAGGSTRIPRIQNCLQHFFQGKNLTISQNLEVATSYGVACQAFFLSRRENWRGHSLSLQDATPFSLGIKGPQGTMLVFVPKNTNIPFKMESTYRFTRSAFLVEVYEGEGTMVPANKLLGKFELSGVHVTQNWNNIRICFEMLENGILKVVAEDISTGRRNGLHFTIRNIEDSKKRVWEALHYEEREKSRIEASTTKSLTRSGTSKNWERLREKQTLGKLLSRNKERSEKIMGQSSRHYVEPDEYAIGIDFGSTHSRVAVWQRNGVKVIENEYGSRYTCSVVAFTDTGRLIGDTVHKEQVTTNPTNIIPNIKSLIGRCHSDDTKLLPFRVICDDKNRYMVSVHYKNEEKVLAPEEIAAMILSKMKEVAEAHLNSKVSKAVKAVISVPSSFNSSQRKAIMDAGAIAGLDVLQLLNETTAAAIAYFIQKVGAQNTSEKTLLIFDLGGGNLDVSIVNIKGGSIHVQAVAGDTNLGGEHFDNNMVSNCVDKFRKEMNKDIHNKPKSLRRLRAACEKAKRILSTNAQTVVEVDALDEGIDFRSVITRKEFEELNDDLFKKCISCVERCLQDATVNKDRIDEVVLVGGSTRIPKIQQLLQEFFDGKELCKSINADEAVVHGAAVQAAILSENEDKKKFNISELEDVTTASFWHVHKDGKTMDLLIPKHTPIPAKKELIISNCSDNLSSFSIEVEERELASMEVQGCEFKVSEIAQKMRGNSRINLAFEVDSSGILNLTGKDVNGREEKEITISKDNCGLTVKEIQEMSEAAARYKAEDDEHKERTAALNSLENLAYKIKAKARDPKASPSDKTRMDEAADSAIKWIDENHDAAMVEISKQLEDLQKKVPEARS